MSTLYVFMGSHGSERNKKAKQFGEKRNLRVIEADEIRKSSGEIPNNILFENIYRILRESLKKEDVVFDATNLIAKQRKHLLSQLKHHETHGYFVVNRIETCTENDKQLETPLGADFVLSRFLSTDLPFIEEGWTQLQFIVEPLAEEVVATYQKRKDDSTFQDEVLQWTDAFLKAGKPYLEQLSPSHYKKIGYNNISAYIAYHALHELDMDQSVIKDVVTLILYRKRWLASDEKGKEKIRNFLSEIIFEKLLLILPQQTA